MIIQIYQNKYIYILVYQSKNTNIKFPKLQT